MSRRLTVWAAGAGCVLLVLVPGAANAVPPAAPTPTSTANSPDAPDPHPPLGGLDPSGHPVGGARLLERGVVVAAGAPALPPGVTAASWALVDLDTGDVLAARDPHGRYQPASILKTLTSVTLLPLLPGARMVTVSHDAAAAEGSAVGLVEGGRYSVDQLFTGLLLESGNDTAAALAEAAGGVAHTVELMNATAQRLGAYDTFVQTPSGLDGWQQLTSAYDMSLFLQAAVDQPRFVAYDQQATGELPTQNVEGRQWPAIALANQSENFLTGVAGAIVAKTGYTDAASHTYLCATERNGRRLGVVLLRAQRWPTDQWQQAASLLDWGYALPDGTARVGHLDSPRAARATAAATASGTRSADSSAPSAARSSGTKPSTHHNPVLGYLAVGALLAGLGVLTRRRRPRRR